MHVAFYENYNKKAACGILNTNIVMAYYILELSVTQWQSTESYIERVCGFIPHEDSEIFRFFSFS